MERASGQTDLDGPVYAKAQLHGRILSKKAAYNLPLVEFGVRGCSPSSATRRGRSKSHPHASSSLAFRNDQSDFCQRVNIVNLVNFLYPRSVTELDDRRHALACTSRGASTESSEPSLVFVATVEIYMVRLLRGYSYVLSSVLFL